MSLEIRQYQAADLMSILEDGACQPNIHINGSTLDRAKAKEDTGPGVTAVDDGRIIACAGMQVFWPGVGEAWCTFVEDIGRYSTRLATLFRPVVRDWVADYDLHRLQAIIRSDFGAGIRMVEWIGFKQDAELPQYFHDKVSALVYSILGDT